MDMENLVSMSARVMHEIIEAYNEDYFDNKYNKELLLAEIDESSYEIILDWAKLCSHEEYDELVDNPKVYQNVYDEAFDRGRDAAITILFGK